MSLPSPFEEVEAELEQLQADPTMKTESIYSPGAINYPGNQLPFVQVHLNYLRKHQNVNPMHYLSNLKIMIKRR